MKTSGHLIFYISENEDFELWRVLSQFPPDDRAAFVKAALKKAVLMRSDTGNKLANSVPNNPISDLALEGLADSHILTAEEKEALKYFEHEQDEDVEDLDELQFDDLLQASESMATTTLPGLSFLLNNVIGEEEDEEVIAFIRNNKTMGEDIE